MRVLTAVRRMVFLWAPTVICLTAQITFGTGLPVWAQILDACTAMCLLLRHRWPVLIFIATLPASTADAGGLFVTVFALYALVTSDRPRRWAMWAAAAVVLAVIVSFVLQAYPNFGHVPSFLYTVLLNAALAAGGPTVLGLAVRNQRELVASLAELERRQRRERELLTAQVVADERTRLAREMHDVVSHQVSLIAIQAAALRMTAPTAAVRENAETIRSLGAKTLDELRQMVTVLRGSDRPAARVPFAPTLADIRELAVGSGLHVNLTIDPEAFAREWPDPVVRAAYRTVQEALTNAGKHASGSAVDVILDVDGDDLDITVRNDPGLRRPTSEQLPGGGHGLIGLRERAEILAGTFTAESTVDGGFVVHAKLPASAAVR